MNRALPLAITFVAAGILLTAACRGAPVITRVTVRNAEFEQLRTLASSRELEHFSLLFAQKKKTSPPQHVAWAYKVDLEVEGRAERWLYHPDGWLQVLSKAETPVYMLDSPAEFRKLVLE